MVFPSCLRMENVELRIENGFAAIDSYRPDHVELLKAGRIVTLCPAISTPTKGLVDVVKGFDSAPLLRKKFFLPCAPSGASPHPAGGERRRASFIAVVREIRRQNPFPSNDRAWRGDRRD